MVDMESFSLMPSLNTFWIIFVRMSYFLLALSASCADEVLC